MKKLSVILVVFVLAAGAVFAQSLPTGVSMSFWGQMAYVPFELEIIQKEPNSFETKNKITTGIGPSWGMQSNGRAANIDIKGNTDSIGFEVEIEADASIRLGEYALIWAKPFGGTQFSDLLRLKAGIFMDHEFRGTRSGRNLSAFALKLPEIDIEDAVFNRFAINHPATLDDDFHEAGALFSINPGAVWESLYGLSIATLLQIRMSELRNSPRGAVGPKFIDSIDRIQVVAGYRIPGIGFVRAQFLNAPEFTPANLSTPNKVYGGRYESWDFEEVWEDNYYNKFKRVEAAFALYAVPNLALDIGFKIPFPESLANVDYSAPIVAALEIGRAHV
jgi:hypothetical protein